MEQRDLVSHLMVKHHLDVSRLPNPQMDELVCMHDARPHHIHDAIVISPSLLEKLIEIAEVGADMMDITEGTLAMSVIQEASRLLPN